MKNQEPIDGARSFNFLNCCSCLPPLVYRNFIISPVGSSQDPSGTYVRRWVPELQKLPTRYLHKPWEAPKSVLDEAGVVLGETYPQRCITELEQARRASRDADADGYDLIQLPDGQLTKVFTRREFRLPNDAFRAALKGSKRKPMERQAGRKPDESEVEVKIHPPERRWKLKASTDSIDLD
eukprot:g13307.t1